MAANGSGEWMAFNDQTFSTAVENIAAEQLLLDSAESGEGPDEVLRVWQPESLMVVMGRGGKVADDVNVDRCQHDNIPVLRRISGGGTIITGPGCLMYTVVLSLIERPDLRDISRCHRFVGEQLKRAYRACGHQIELRGHSDLCIGEKKFSGNALRVGRSHLIYHGTLLVDFELDLIPQYLKQPPRQPEYRQLRDHLDFVCNLRVDVKKLVEEIRNVFRSGESRFELDAKAIQSLVQERYSDDAWNLRM